MLKALRIVALVETTGDTEVTDDGRLEVPIRLLDPPTGEETVAEVAGVDASRAPSSGEQWLALLIGGTIADAYLVRRVARPGDLVETDPGVYRITPPEGEKVRIVVSGGADIDLEAPGASVNVAAAAINLGSFSPAFTVALAEKVSQVLTQRDGVFAGHTHIVTVPLIPIGPAPSATPIPTSLGTGDMSSTKVKAD